MTIKEREAIREEWIKSKAWISTPYVVDLREIVVNLMSDMDESDAETDACYKIFCKVCDERDEYKARAEAMERAIMGRCRYCKHWRNDEDCKYATDGSCRNRSLWHFDKDRFAKEAGK